ncbi:MAG TPA: hypothetical protein VFV50_10735 [Bdellovibrionales bacterium]|nr:hypothetical protein [Bdellovibrionales bacterium]
MNSAVKYAFFALMISLFTAAASAQGLEACLALQTKNPGVRDPIRDLLSSDFRCTVPAWLPRMFLMRDDPATVFHTACIVHDLCYKHGSYTYQLSRRSCDDEFRERMTKTCNARYQDENLLRCRADAAGLYEVVRKVGFLFYLSPPGYNDFPDGIEPYTNDHGVACKYLD